MIFSLASILAVSALVNANMVQNGGFENHASLCKQDWCVETDESAIAPWTITSAYKSFELDSSPSPWKAYSGKWSVDLNSDNAKDAANTFSQTIETVVGKKYELSFQLNGNPCEAPIKTGFVRATGSNELNFTYSEAVNKQLWVPITYRFKATESRTTIDIGSTTLGTCGPVIDEVSMLPVNVCQK